MSWDRIGYLAWLRANAAAVRDAIGVSTGGGTPDNFRTISSFPATIPSDDVVLEVTVAGTLALPTPTAGRKLVFINDDTLTLTASAVEQREGGFSTSLSLVAGENVCLRGNGTQWRRSRG